MLKNRLADDSIEDSEIDNQDKSEAKELVKDVYKNIKFSFKWCGMSIECLEAIKIRILACDFSVSTMQKWNEE